METQEKLKHYQYFDQPSLVELGQAYTLREIINRNKAGEELPVGKTPQYFDDETPPVYRYKDLDLSEIQNQLNIFDELKDTINADALRRERAESEEQAEKVRMEKVSQRFKELSDKEQLTRKEQKEYDKLAKDVSFD